MTTYTNGLPFDSSNRLMTTDIGVGSVPSTAVFSNGYAFNNDDGSVYVCSRSVSSAVYHNGLAFTADGALFMVTTAPSTIYNSGLFPTDSNGAAYFAYSGTIDHYQNGVGFTSTGAAVITGQIAAMGPITLYNDFRVGTLTSQSGPAFSLTRATTTTSYDSTNAVVNISSGQPRWYRIGASSGVTGLWVYGSHTNLCLQSENFGTTWAAVGTPTRVAGNTTCGVVSLDLIGDDDATALEGYTQTITFTGNAVKSVSVFVSAGTSTSSVIRLRDTTAVADRLLATLAWSGGVPTATMTTGTHEAGSPDMLANGVYRFRFNTTSVTAANTNSLQVYPATTAALAVANTGTVNVGGVMAQNALTCAPYVATTTGTVTVNADVFTASGAGVINASEGTLFVQAIGPVDGATGSHVFLCVDDGTTAEFEYLSQSSNQVQIAVNDNSASQAVVNVTNMTAGSASKLAGRYKLNSFNISRDGTAGTADTSGTLPTTTTFRLDYPTVNTAPPNTIIQVVAYSPVGATDANLAAATA